MALSDNPSQGAPSPELQSAQKRVNALELDIANLRRGMVQQLTASGKLLKAVFTLDQDYFGGRFQAQESPEGKTPIRDLTVATQVVEAVSEQLAGESAFADSPMLRDCVATMVAAVESLRNQAIEVERVGAEAVGLPAKKDIFPARTFPENNPLACLNDAAAFSRDVQSVITRTRDRIGALKMMLAEAERSRVEAEAAIPTVNIEEVSKRLSDELKSRDAEVASLRAQTLRQQEGNAADVRRARAELAQAQEALSREVDLRRADHAEARSLAAEIERMAGADPEAATSDDLDITLSVLHDQLESGADIASVAAAAEAVMVNWVRLITARAETAGAHLSDIQAKVGGPAKQIQALETELAKARTELAAAKAAAASSAASASGTVAELAAARKEAAEIQARLAAREQEVKRLSDERGAEKAALAKEREELAAKARAGEGAKGEDAVVRTQLAEVTRSLQTSELAVRAREEALKLRDQDVQRIEAELVKLREQSQLQLNEQKAKADAAGTDLAKLRAESSRLAPALAAATDKERMLTSEKAQLEREREQLVRDREQLSRERDQLKARLDEQRKATESGLAQSRSELDAVAKTAEAARAAEKLAREEMARTGAALSAGSARVNQLERDIAQLRAEKEKAVAGLSQVKQEKDAVNRKATDLELERTKLAGKSGEAEAKLRDLAQETERLKAAYADAAKRGDALTAELAQTREKLSAAVAAREQAAAQKASLQDAEATLVAQRDAARVSLSGATAERDRLKSGMERLQADHEALGRRLEEREAQLNARIAETTKQLGELKLAQAKLQSENERLQSDAAARQAAAVRDAGPSEGTATWSKRLIDSSAMLEDARKKSSELTRKVEEQKRQLADMEDRLARSKQAESHLGERIGELERNEARLKSELSSNANKNLGARIAKLEDDLATERQRRQEMAALLTESRTAVMKARKALTDVGM